MMSAFNFAATLPPTALPAFVSAPERNRVMTFGSDLPMRRLLFHDDVFKHPAKLHLGLLRWILETYTHPGETILDPMAGSGSLMLGAYLERNIILRDVQPEYVAMMRDSELITRRAAGFWCGRIDIAEDDARTAQYPPFQHIVCSPPYGIEVGTDGSFERRKERLLTVDHDSRWHRKFSNAISDKFRYAGGHANIGNKSGRSYWTEMQPCYANWIAQMPPNGYLILILKNHYRRGELKDITGQTIELLSGMNLKLASRMARRIDNPSLWQRRRKEQGKPIVEHEDVLVFAAAVSE